MSMTRIVYQRNPLSLTDDEEKALEEVAIEYDEASIDGNPVYWIAADTIEEHIEAMEIVDKEKLAILRSLDKKLKLAFGEDFDAFDFLLE